MRRRSMILFGGVLALAGCAGGEVSRMEALGVVSKQPPLPDNRTELRFIPVGAATNQGQWLLPVEFNPRDVALIHGNDVADVLASMPRLERR